MQRQAREQQTLSNFRRNPMHFVRTKNFRWLIAGIFCCVASLSIAAAPPNVVIIFCDDMGYADPSCFGNTKVMTANIDKLAEQGTRFTSFYVPQAVCGASRAGLLTGCYPNRIGMLGAPGPKSKSGIAASEKLLGEVCKERGYATALFGKWHLGDNQKFLPLQHGFDEYLGLPYSNDMWPHHPQGGNWPPLPLIEGNKVINKEVSHADQEQLTKQYTEHAVDFIKRHAQGPFFLEVAYAMPHVPLHVSEKFKGKSGVGLYGDVLLEIDWSVGQIMKALDDNKIADNTFIVFTSDNGPWLSYGNHAGSKEPLREGKGSEWEGGVRVPCVMRWPGKIPAGRTCDEPLMTIDLLPTIAKWNGGTLPEHKIDGLDASDLIQGKPDAKSPHESYALYYGNELQAVRAGDWKLVLPHTYRNFVGPPGADGKPNGYKQTKTELALYNLRDDVGEAKDVQLEHPEIVAKLQQLAEAYRADLGDSLQKKPGTGKRPPGKLE
jgi:arylsulfatase A